jgi:hypothetical protein
MSEEETGVPEGAIGRLLHDLTVGTIQAVRRKDRVDAQNQLREVEQQIQFVVEGKTGRGGTVPDFTTREIEFDYSFHFAPASRDSPLEYPHFSAGSQTLPPVVLHVTVEKWLHNEQNGAINGCIVNVGATGTPEPVTFTGVAFLTFQGFGALIEDDEGEE